MANKAEFKLLQEWFKKLNLSKYKSITINQLNQLKKFDLRHCKLDDLSLLPHIPQVKVLQLQNATLPEDLTPLLDCKDDIEAIFFNNTNITEKQLEVLTKLSKLKRLDFTNCKLVNLSTLENHPTLEMLDVTGCNVKDIPKLPKLKTLYGYIDE